MLILAWPGLTLFVSCSAPNSDSVAKAAIIDQIAILEPNQVFLDQMTRRLEACGFEVYVYQGEKVDVKLYRELPKYGYKLIIFRAHGGLLAVPEDSQLVVKQETHLFTAEEYKQNKYVREQLDDQMGPGEMWQGSPWVFAVNSKFILESMEGKFEDTVIIMMGCSGAHLDDMAAAFVLKGASTYLGWGGSVGLGYVDQATADLIINLCEKKMTVEQAVAGTMAKVGADPDWGATLKYYPRESGVQTIGKVTGGIAGD